MNIEEIRVIEPENPNDQTLLVTSNIDDTPYVFGSLLVEFSNIRNSDETYYKTLDDLEECAFRDIPRTLESVSEYMNRIFSSYVSDIVMLGIKDALIKRSSNSSKDVAQILVDSFAGICDTASGLAGIILQSNGCKEWSNAFEILHNEQVIRSTVSMSFIIGERQSERSLATQYDFTDAISLIIFDYIKSVRYKQTIKQCENCNKYFIPSKRRSEIYCKECRAIGYEKTGKKKNPIQVIFRKIYQRQYKRYEDNKLKIDGIDIRFEEWIQKTKLERGRCKNGEITLEEFEANISGAEWMSGK